MSLLVDEFDVELAFEAELQRIRLEDWSLGKEFNCEDEPCCLDIGDGEDDEGEPRSLQLLRTALERRERAAEDFERELHRFCHAITAVDSSRVASGPEDVLFKDPPGVRVESGSSSCSSLHNVVQDAVVERIGERRHWTQDRCCLQNDANSRPLPSDQLRIEPVLNVLKDVGTGRSRDASGRALHVGVDATANDLEETRSLMAEQDLARGVPVDSEKCTAGKEAADQEHRALAELYERFETDGDERQAEDAAAAAEQNRLTAETDVMLRRLELAWAQAAEREARQQAALAALREEATQLARRHMAAWCIARAWRRYRQGPVRAMRLAAAVRIQAAWRGNVGRRNALRLRIEKAILQAAEDAVARGHVEQLRSATCHAQEIGIQDVLQMRLVELEGAVSQAADKLRAAAANGTYSEYKSALMMAKRFPCLEQLVSDSSALFDIRQAEAEASVWAATTDLPMRSFHRVLESASPMGIKQDRLAAALEAVRQRDEEILTRLAAASRAQGRFFSLVEFEALVERAFRLGLKGEAAAAHLVLERRRRSLAQVLHTRASNPLSNAAASLGLLEEARRMGMVAEAEDVMQQLQSRQRVLQAALTEAVVKDSAARALIFIKHALDLHVPASALQDAKLLLSKRRATGSETVINAARCGSFHEFLAARGAGVHGGVELAKLLPADRALTSRRRAALFSLGQEAAIMCSGAFPAWTNSSQSLALVVGIGGARAVLERSVEGGVNTSATCGSKPLFAGSQVLQQKGSANLHRDIVPQRVDLWRISEFKIWSAYDRCRGNTLHASVTEWPSLLSMVQLGLPDVSSLVLCVLDLQQAVHTAEEASCLLAANVERDYWGLPLLYTTVGSEAACVHAVVVAFRTGRVAGCRSLNAPEDELAKRLISLIKHHTCMVGIRPWWALPQVPVLPAVQLCEAFGRSYLSTVLVQPTERVCESVAPHCSMLSLSSAWKAHKSLTEIIILRNVPGITSQVNAIGTACLPPLFRLDLGLERLTSLHGLDCLCPSLRSLSADANQLSSLDGLNGLVKLQALSLKQNHLTSLVHLAQTGQALVALPSGTCLQRLMLDSNKLSGQLKGLSRCSGLRSLSLADNALTDVGSDLEPSRAVLTSLSVRCNHLTSLGLQLASLTTLRELDVSGNRLTSLEGIQGLLLLRSLYASGNAITVLPKPFCLPYLTALDLGQNVLTAFGNSGDLSIGVNLALPRLKSLVLQENCISLLGPLGPMLHLTMLDLSFNNLASWDALLALVHLSGLRKLHVGNNPMMEPMAESNAPAGIGFQASDFYGFVSRQGNRLSRLVPSSNSNMLWALPSLHELDHHDVEPQFRLDTAIRATAGLPNNTISGIRQTRAFGSCYVVNPGARPVIPTVAFGRHHHHGAPAGGRIQRWSHAYFIGIFGVQPNPVAIGSILLAANWAVGRNALCGLYAETTCLGAAGCVQPLQCIVSLRQEPDTVGSEVSCSHEIVPPTPAAASEWLECLGRLWHATVASETLHLHIRQLAVSEGFTSTANTHSVLVPQYFRAIDASSAPASNSLGPFEHLKVDLMDFGHLHCLRPSVRSFQYLTSTGIWSKGHVPAVNTAAADTKEPAGRIKEPSVLAIGAEAHSRYEVSSCRAGRQLMEDFWKLLEQQSGRRIFNFKPVLLDKRLLNVRPSYFFFRMCQHARTATTIIQASWRGLQGRKEVHGIRTNAQLSAAIAIQAWWRGYCVRKAELLHSSREANKQQRDFHRRDGAAITIQAHFRGYLVRKRLRIALTAVLQPSESATDSDSMVDSGELDEMLQEFLGPTEKILLGDDQNRSQALTSPVECGAFLPSVQQVPNRNVQQQSNPHDSFPIPSLSAAWVRPQLTLVALSGSSTHTPKRTVPGEDVVKHEMSGAALRLVGSVPPMSLGSLLPSDIASVHSTGFEVPVIRQVNAASAAISPMLIPACVLPPIPCRSSALQTAIQSGTRGISSCHSKMACCLPEDGAFSPSRAMSLHTQGGSTNEISHREHGVPAADLCARNREQRHQERLQKLMVEWGFKDLATAEVYYRRSVRQQGHARRKFRDKNQDFTQRHLKMPCKLEDSREDAIINGNSRSSSGMRLSGLDMPSSTERCKQLFGAPSSLQRNLSSADGVLLGSVGCTAGDMLPRINCTRSQSGGDDLRPADNGLPACSGGNMLANLHAVGAYEVLSKPGMAQRPHHLPTLTSNNWILPSNLQSPRRNMSGGCPSNVVGLTTREDASDRPGTVQSVDSSADLIML
nr:hypothetical protein [Volvox reticuliferus]